MSAQSIVIKDRCAMQEEYTNRVLKNANDYILKKRFDLGKVSEHYKMDFKILNIIYKDNCELVETMYKEILEKDS